MANSEEIVKADPPESGQEMTRMCSVLKTQVPIKDFPRKGNISIKAKAAIEALTKMLKAKWGAEYSVRYKMLKKDGNKWRESLTAIITANESQSSGRGIPMLIPACIWKLVTENFSVDQTTNRDILEPMTWPVFEKFRKSSEGGGYKDEDILQEWQAMETNGTKKDKNGVVNGQPDQKRYWVRAKEQMLADKTKGKRRVAIQEAGGRKKMKSGNVESFVEGEMNFEDEADIRPSPVNSQLEAVLQQTSWPAKTKNDPAQVQSSSLLPPPKPVPEWDAGTKERQVNLKSVALNTTITECNQALNAAVASVKSAEEEVLLNDKGERDPEKVARFQCYVQIMDKRSQLLQLLKGTDSDLLEREQRNTADNVQPVEHFQEVKTLSNLRIHNYNSARNMLELKKLVQAKNEEAKIFKNVVKQCLQGGSDLVKAMNDKRKREARDTAAETAQAHAQVVDGEIAAKRRAKKKEQTLQKHSEPNFFLSSEPPCPRMAMLKISKNSVEKEDLEAAITSSKEIQSCKDHPFVLEITPLATDMLGDPVFANKIMELFFP